MKAMTVLRACAAVAAFSMATALFADGNFSWKGEGGVVTVPAGGAAITDADIADVEALTSIVLADATSAVTAVGLASSLNLSAAVSGPGTLTFTSCAGVTVAGDNSSLTGSFSFNDTPVTVTSRYGLGGADTPHAAFTKGTNGTLSFAGNGLTNDVPLHVPGDLGVQNGTDEVLVQRGDIVVSGDDFYCRNIVLESGALSNGKYSFNIRPYKGCRLCLGSGATVGAKCTTVNLIGEYTAKQPTHFIRLEGASFANTGAISFWNYSVGLELGAENAFPTDREMSVPLGTTADGGIDLCGFDQTMPVMTTAQYTPKESETRVFLTVSSERPATLKFTDANACAVQMPFRFRDAAGFWYAGNGSYTITHHLSDTTGDLTVSSGTVTFDWNAGWGSGNVTVDGGALVCNSPRSLTTSTGRLVVSGEGRLSAAEGVSLKVASCKLGTVELQKGIEYAKADLDELGCGEYFSGDGIISVADDGSEFVWPDAPGGTVTIPVDKTVPLTASDVAKVVAYDSIKLSTGSRILAKDIYEDFVFPVSLSGNGEFSAVNVSNIVLSGDNSALGGGFTFEDCGVIVSNRYGLGSATTRYADFTMGTGGSLVFGGEGATNDVPLHLHGDQLKLHYETTEPFWQNADVELDDTDNNVTFRLGNVTFLGGCVHCSKTLFYLIPQSGATVVFEPDSALSCSYLYLLAPVVGKIGGTLIFNTADLSYANFIDYTYTLHMTLTAADSLRKTVNWTIWPGQDDFGVDLAADQSVPYVKVENVTIEKTMAASITINGLKPATLTMTNVGETGNVGPLKFSGEAGLTIDSENGSYRIVKQVSDTCGPLSVLSGTLTFDWGAGWGGTNVTIGANGTLAITADSSGVGLYTEDGARRNTLIVENGGTLDLAENVCVTSHWAKANGEWLKRGVYGGAEAGLDAAHTLPFITGRGRLAVRKSYGSGLMLIFR